MLCLGKILKKNAEFKKLTEESELDTNEDFET
jgi:hypothetical protein